MSSGESCDAHPPRRWLAPGDADWPAELADLEQLHRPLATRRLWVEGDGPLPPFPGVAVVGARRATATALETARRIGADLARLRITVISGFAKGVDAAAHRGCLAVGGRTVAVLGCGLGVDYPPEHRELRQQIGRIGALMTEYEHEMEPDRWHFPRRNRIIAALSRAVIVVEADLQSGALSTASWATRLGREVLAVPGSILSPANSGTNLLLRDGARPYLDPTDLSDVFPQCWVEPPHPVRSAPKPTGRTRTGEPPTMLPVVPPTDDADRDQMAETPAKRLISLLGTDPVPRELLVRTLGIEAAEFTVLLGELELAGMIRCLPGGSVVREGWVASPFRAMKSGQRSGQIPRT